MTQPSVLYSSHPPYFLSPPSCWVLSGAERWAEQRVEWSGAADRSGERTGKGGGGQRIIGDGSSNGGEAASGGGRLGFVHGAKFTQSFNLFQNTTCSVHVVHASCSPWCAVRRLSILVATPSLPGGHRAGFRRGVEPWRVRMGAWTPSWWLGVA